MIRWSFIHTLFHSVQKSLQAENLKFEDIQHDISTILSNEAAMFANASNIATDVKLQKQLSHVANLLIEAYILLETKFNFAQALPNNLVYDMRPVKPNIDRKMVWHMNKVQAILLVAKSIVDSPDFDIKNYSNNHGNLSFIDIDIDNNMKDCLHDSIFLNGNELALLKYNNKMTDYYFVPQDGMFYKNTHLLATLPLPYGADEHLGWA